MSTAAQSTAEVAASVAKLTITSPEPNVASESKKLGAGKTKNQAKEVADSWEDEEVSSDPESDPEDDIGDPDSSRPSTSASTLPGTQAPPPTPISPSYQRHPGGTQAPPPTPVNPSYQGASFAPGAPAGISAALAASGAEELRRPEKTDAVARRMIASALGVKVPKQTEDQKAYDKAMREKERKRREEEREAEKKRLEEAEKAKKAIWED